MEYSREHSSTIPDSSSNVGTQADIILQSSSRTNSNIIGGYVSDDDAVMIRQLKQQRVNTGRISREDFREQYCINERVLEGLNDKSRSTGFLFGCLSSYQESPCKKRDNLFTSCYGRHPSDENIHGNGHENVHVNMGPRVVNHGHPGPHARWSASHEHFMDTSTSGDEGGFEPARRPQSVAVSRENLYNEAKRYTWNEQMERYVERGSSQDWTRRLATRYPSAPVPQIESTRKHVSFDCSSLARSATSNSFDEHKIRKARWEVVLMNRQSSSQERLLDGRKTPDMTTSIATQPQYPPEKKKTTKTQATQTETFIVRASGPPPYLSLSPRTSYRVRMVSQGAQTNGGLMDKYISQSMNLSENNNKKEALSKVVSSRQPISRAPLQKTLSDGEILLERKKAVTTGYMEVDIVDNSSSPIPAQEPTVTKYRVNEKPVRFSSDVVEIFNEEEFHENILGLLRSPTTTTTTTTTNETTEQTVVKTTTTTKSKKITQLSGGSMDSGCSRETESSRKTTSPTESSSSGSYSLFDYNGTKPKFKLDLRGVTSPQQQHQRHQQSQSQPHTMSAGSYVDDSWLSSQRATPTNKLDIEDDNSMNESSVFASQNLEEIIDFVVKPPDGWGDSPETPTNNSIVNMDKQIILLDDLDDTLNDNALLLDNDPRIRPILRHPREEDQQHQEEEEELIAAQKNHQQELSLAEQQQLKKKRKYRCKSEERPFKESTRSDAATQSSISLHASLHDLSTIDDDDSGIYMEPYTLGIWVYIGENEEIQVWQKHEPVTRTSSGESTMSEKEFRKKFTALTHRMVHRKASGETYRRLASNTLEINKRVTVTRQGGEFGFRIHGSRPVVVSAVESSTPAEDSGLEVGDVIMTINGISVLDSSHSDVVRIAAKTDLLEMELARTANILSSDQRLDIVYSGYLFKLHNDDTWVQRWFTLKSDYCLHYYKSETSVVPLGAVSLVNCQLRHVHKLQNEDTYDHIFQIQRLNGPSLILATTSHQSKEEWMNVIDTAIQQSSQDDKWIALSGRYVTGPPEAILNSDCSGYLGKLGRRLKTWTRRYCVLKDACIYFFTAEEVTSALGAAHLHGYRVQTVSSLGGRKYAFELIPPQPTMRSYYLSTDTENDRKRWLAALEYSIDRWINLGK